MPGHDADIVETSGHHRLWRDDLALMRRLGATRLRYPIRWHRIEASPGRYRWSETDAVMEHMREEGMRPIIDLVHHTSYPRWLADGFADPRFGPHYLRFCEAVAERYGWVEEYTLFNEPFATLFLSGHEAVWPPYHHGMEGFVGLLRNVLPAIAEASRMYRDLLPGADHVWVDSCEGHTALDPVARPYADLCNDRRFFVLDALLGRAGDTGRPFVRAVCEAGGEDLLGIEPGRIDVLGLDYYAHHEWAYRRGDGAVPIEVAGKERHPHGPGHPQVGDVEGCTPSPRPRGLARLAVEYWEHFRIPRMILGETNMAGAASDRAT
jgi:beta-glucosidase/6-phospho-beta-glucosidase/beta-galactosidase